MALVHWWSQRTTNRRCHQQLGPHNTNTPNRVPNTTLQQTSSQDITTVSNSLYSRTSSTTQHALTSEHLPIITTINIRHDYILQQNRQESWLDTIHGRHRVCHTHHTIPTNIHTANIMFRNIILMADKHNIPTGQDARQLKALSTPHIMQNHTKKQHKERKHLWSSSQTLKCGDNYRHTKT